MYNDHTIFETWNYIYIPVFAVRRGLGRAAWAEMTVTDALGLQWAWKLSPQRKDGVL